MGAKFLKIVLATTDFPRRPEKWGGAETRFWHFMRENK